MYTPSHFLESRLTVLHELIRAHPFATIVAQTNHGLDAEHVPLLLDVGSGSSGVLQGHIARANPMGRELCDGTEVLVVFQGPDHYVSPSWYASKKEHGKVVPTWNYVVVHVRGHLMWRQDAGWLRGLVERTTDAHEEGRAHRWRVSDAPPQYLERMLGSIVGFEIPISTVTGKWKLGQNRSAEDRSGVISGLEAESSDAATEMVERMHERGSSS
jgi:transcriptional regulator